MTLPALLVLTDRTQTGARSLAEVVAAAVAGGAPAVVLREKDLSRVERCRLADLLRPLIEVLIVASDPTIPADGVHLAAADPFPLGHAGLLGRSCHSADDLARAADEGCDYATLSPVFPSASKPGYGPALGVDALRESPLPVYALGGVTPANAPSCRSAGAVGVAVIGAVMAAENPARVVKALLG